MAAPSPTHPGFAVSYPKEREKELIISYRKHEVIMRRILGQKNPVTERNAKT